jgi:hypothetical protein
MKENDWGRFPNYHMKNPALYKLNIVPLPTEVKKRPAYKYLRAAEKHVDTASTKCYNITDTMSACSDREEFRW